MGKRFDAYGQGARLKCPETVVISREFRLDAIGGAVSFFAVDR